MEGFFSTWMIVSAIISFIGSSYHVQNNEYRNYFLEGDFFNGILQFIMIFILIAVPFSFIPLLGLWDLFSK